MDFNTLIPTFENFSKQYDEAYNNLQEDNERCVIDFSFFQDVENLQNIKSNLLTKISLEIERCILFNLKKQFEGRWTADSGSHDNQDNMVASVYISDEDKTVGMLKNLLDNFNYDESTYEDNRCIVTNSEYAKFLITENDMRRLIENGVPEDVVEEIADSFSVDITIVNPTEKIIELFE